MKDEQTFNLKDGLIYSNCRVLLTSDETSLCSPESPLQDFYQVAYPDESMM